MNPQLALDFSKRARREDPDTSKVAAASAVQFGHAHQAAIVGSLMTQGPGTIYEIGERTGLDHVAVARRMKELQELGAARPREETKAGPTGRQCRVWEAT